MQLGRRDGEVKPVLPKGCDGRKEITRGMELRPSPDLERQGNLCLGEKEAGQVRVGDGVTSTALGRRVSGMSSSSWEVVTESWWDDKGALAKSQGVEETGGGLGAAGKGARQRQEACRGIQTQREGVLGNSAPAPQSLPSTALWLSSGFPQYSHLALGNTSVAISPVPTPRV